jgi:hypothetical protein
MGRASCLSQCPHPPTLAVVAAALFPDGHMAIMLGVAQIVAAAREGLRGSVRILFQPAEEDACPEKGPYGGAYEMVQKVCVRAP